MTQQAEMKDRLYRFALEIVKLVRALPREVAALEIGRQVIKSGTSIAANYEEATCGFSKADFIFKLSTAFKEVKDTKLWLCLLKDSGIVQATPGFEALISESIELANILAKSLKTSRHNLEKRR